MLKLTSNLVSNIFLIDKQVWEKNILLSIYWKMKERKRKRKVWQGRDGWIRYFINI